MSAPVATPRTDFGIARPDAVERLRSMLGNEAVSTRELDRAALAVLTTEIEYARRVCWT